jgi:hypothetical protein
MDCKSLLYEKVDLIKDKELAGLVKTILNTADGGFWIAPSSSSGKYHPPEDQGEGGIIRHTIKAVSVVDEESRRKMFEDYERDCALAAIILHDIKKNGEPWGDHTVRTHGILGAEFIRMFFEPDDLKGKMIIDAVRYHMAPWNTTIPKERLDYVTKTYINLTQEELKTELDEKIRGQFPNKIEKAVQDADYWASRTDMSFFPGVNVPLIDRHDFPDNVGINALK